MNVFKKPNIRLNNKSTTTNGDNSHKSKRSRDDGDLPTLLTITPQQQRDKFDELNEVEANRIVEGLNNPTESIWSLTAAISRRNKDRNRYSNVMPWNETRVKLPVKNEATYSDYINASYIKLQIKGETLINRYIACQGPLETTRNHFWSMCFNESEKQGNDVVIIAMVTPLIEQGMTKCDKYWPELGDSWSFNRNNLEDGIALEDLTVKNVNETYDPNEDYLLTEFELKSGIKTKKVYHFYYYRWADAKVPPSTAPLANLSRHIDEIKQATTESLENQPVPIIHCSAGVGRSGTFMVYDHLFRHRDKFRAILDTNRAKDLVYKAVFQLRTQRMMMVQTVYQYQFLYDVAKEAYYE
ncbi:PTP1 [Candida theae]|uniref:protein-tyrosine-phosphatase n=1 Tax=Candida theae TaxID=1198502 RepID=A0AAD5G015_9ASCO|nr:PTP1 [Candida theae]KAI5964417.1 PTP1 [Candida theae]